ETEARGAARACRAMSDPLPVLSYATPIGKELPPERLAVEFPPPPVRQEMFVNLLGLIASVIGGLVLCALPVWSYSSRRPSLDPPMAIIAGGFGLVVLLFAYTRWRTLRRLRGYDGSPVRIELREHAALVFTDPFESAHRRETI